MPPQKQQKKKRRKNAPNMRILPSSFTYILCPYRSPNQPNPYDAQSNPTLSKYAIQIDSIATIEEARAEPSVAL